MAQEIWMWLAAGLGYGAVNTGELLAAYPGGASEVYSNLGGPLLDEILTQKQAEKLAQTRPEDFALRLNHMRTQGVRALAYDDDAYPEMLRNIGNPPLVLFVKGDESLLNGQLSIGIVGTRRPSAYGSEVVKAVGRGVALGGAIIVSGLAAGLDAEAHKAALAVNGPTIACIAFGHDTCYPASNKKLLELIERYGAVISEYPIGTTPEKHYFLQRNRIIAGMSHGLIVAEARTHSGTMSTVNFAAEYGRDVFAIPGSIFSELSSGTNAMIREGAYLAASATDVLAVYNIQLSGEDPVAAAIKQAAEGRPAAAPATMPVWQQNMDRRSTAQAEVQAAEPAKPWQQTLAEALQSELHKEEPTAVAAGTVTSKQASNAFRKLQQMMPGASGHQDAESADLDERVAAVSDSVEIRGRSRAVGHTEDGRPVQSYKWDGIERISRTDAENSPTLATEPSAPPVSTKSRPARPGPISRVEPVGRVESVTKTYPVYETPALSPKAESTAPPTRAAKASPAPAAPASHYADTLSNKLRTMQTPAAAKKSAAKEAASLAGTYTPPRKTPPKEPSLPVHDIIEKLSAEAMAAYSTMPTDALANEPNDGQGNAKNLSAAATRALKQLGAQPLSLTQICQQSGLSSGEVMAALTELELAGLSRQLAGRQFVIMQ